MATKSKEEDQNLPATTAAPGLPAALAAAMSEDAGKGTSTAQEDNIIPLIYILQAQSPQCNKRGPDYVEGAEAGSIWLRNAGLPAVPGAEGILFQPCHFSKDWVEWIPRAAGGGFVGRHEQRPADAKQVPDPQNPDKMRWMLENGHEVVETRYHIGYVHLGASRMPFVIPMTSTAHTASRQLMFMMNSKQISPSQRAPAWACLYRLKTKSRTNAAGTWDTWDIEDAGWIESMDDYNRGKALYEGIASGEKQIDTPEAQSVDPGENAAM